MKRLLLLLLLLGCVGFAMADEADWRRQMIEGQSAYRRGDYGAAVIAFEAALRETPIFGPENPKVSFTLNELATAYRVQGRYADAEPLYRRALAIDEKALGPEHPELASVLNNLADLYRAMGRQADAIPLHRRALAIREKALGLEHPDVANSLNNLALLYKEQGRYADAEPLYRRALAIWEKAYGPEHPEVASALNNLAALSRAQGRYAEAEPLYNRALAIAEKALGPEHPNVADALNNLALLYRSQGRDADAEPLYRRSLAIYEKTLGPDHQFIAISLNNLAYLAQAQGRYADADALYRRSLAMREKMLGPDHPQVADSLNNIANLYQAQKRPDEALPWARRATALLAKRYTGRGADARGQIGEQRTRSGGFVRHVYLLDRVRGQGAEAESLEVAQLARASDTADVMAKMALRYAGGTDKLAQLVRARQDLSARAERLDAAILQDMSRPSNRRNPATISRLRAEFADNQRQSAEMDTALERDFPQYRELIEARPLALDAVQRLLGPDEALVSYLISGDASFVWVVRQNNAAFVKLAVNAGALAGAVSRLRRQLDPGGADPRNILTKPFDVAAAFDLYQKVLAPVAAQLAGVRHLIVVPDGALQSLPFGVLVSEMPAGSLRSIADHANVAWLAKQYAITSLPAVASLRALRAFAGGRPGTEPFGGFGDPLLEKGRLPETAEELGAIAKMLKADLQNVYVREQATETRVKSMDLTRFNVLAFATHGVVAGGLRGLTEPALVLTPPKVGSAQDDGLLTAGEISQLKLNTDWVILSACNTAAADGTPGAEGLSGLAKAFFYAGSRSLLVSHWAVNSAATVALTTGMFAEYAKGASKAEALRRAMLALMQQTDKPYYAHPLFWAPFVVVGEGNAGWRDK